MTMVEFFDSTTHSIGDHALRITRP